jgi:hypothetical protein
MKLHYPRVLQRILTLILAVALFTPLVALSDVSGQDSAWRHFDLRHGSMPAGWEGGGISRDEHYFWFIEEYRTVTRFFRRDPMDWAGDDRGEIYVTVWDGSTPTTIQECRNLASDPDRMIFAFWGVPTTKQIVNVTGPSAGSATVGGFPADYYEINYDIEVLRGPSGNPDAPSFWEFEWAVTSRFYCLDLPGGVALVALVADQDYRAETLAFIDTFVITPRHVTAPVPIPAAGVPLCDEAWRFFGDRVMAEVGYPTRDSETKLRLSHQTMLDQIFAAIDDYNQAHQDNPAHVTWTFQLTGTLDAINWLFTEGGLTYQLNGEESNSRSMTFASRDSSDFPNQPPPSEAALRDAIVAKSRDTGRRLDPGDVLRLALEQTGGDARLASLLAHNTLRSLARAGDQHFTGVEWDRAFFTTYLAPIRGVEGAEEPSEPGGTHDPWDNSGVWYHLFGTMYFEMQTRGDWGPYTMGILPAVGLPHEVLNSILNGYLPDFGAHPTDPTYSSRLANAAEQYVRHSMDRRPDPEKFCINVWGARIGAELEWRLVASEGIRWGNAGAHHNPLLPPPLDPVDLPDGGVAGGTVPLDPPATPLGHPVPFEFDPALLPGAPPRQFSGGSPVTIAWQSEAGTAVLDQRAGSLSGFAPVIVLPLFNPDTLTWGAHWYDYHTEPYSLRFEGVDTGTMHLTMFDPLSGQTATWIADVEDGERLRLEMAPGAVDVPLVREDGSKIRPILASLPPIDLTDSASPGSPMPPPVPQTEPVPDGGRGGMGISPTTLLLVSGIAMGIAAIIVLAMTIILTHRGSTVSLTAGTSPPPSAPQSHPAPPGTRPTPAPQAAQSHPEITTPSISACRSCGARLGPRDRFCAACGMPVMSADLVPREGIHFCARCGRPLNPETHSCDACGTVADRAATAS